MSISAGVGFIALWSLLVYVPVCHWIFGGGWLFERGALDFAGGAVVHVNAASAALVAAVVVGPRKDYGRHAILPHHRGVTGCAGLYFLGLPWLHKLKSSVLCGVGDDAAHVAEHITYDVIGARLPRAPRAPGRT